MILAGRVEEGGEILMGERFILGLLLVDIICMHG